MDSVGLDLQYARSLIEAGVDPHVTVGHGVKGANFSNRASVHATGSPRGALISDFSSLSKRTQRVSWLPGPPPAADPHGSAA